MLEASKQKTAFCTPWGKFEVNLRCHPGRTCSNKTGYVKETIDLTAKGSKSPKKEKIWRRIKE